MIAKQLISSYGTNKKIILAFSLGSIWEKTRQSVKLLLLAYLFVRLYINVHNEISRFS